MGKKGSFAAVDSLVLWAAACLASQGLGRLQPPREGLACCCQLLLLEGKMKPFQKLELVCCPSPAGHTKTPLLSLIFLRAAVHCPASFGWLNIDILPLVLWSLRLLVHGSAGELETNWCEGSASTAKSMGRRAWEQRRPSRSKTRRRQMTKSVGCLLNGANAHEYSSERLLSKMSK